MSEQPKTQRQEKQERHAEWHRLNREAIVASGVPFADRGEALLFRVAGKPPVDFYPSTGRWRIPSKPQTWRGGATAFLAWYAKIGARA